MAFRSADLERVASFNSATSSKFLSRYDEFRSSQIKQHAEKPKSQAFAPSQLRCKRLSWFRLRGVEPDEITTPDLGLNFSAEVGTACHEIIQSNLQQMYGEDWIDVKWYLENVLKPTYEYTVQQSGYESLIHIQNPPIRFACDGIIRIDGVYYLLEIKTSEFSSFQKLSDPKPQHIDQIKCYSTLLGLPNVLVMYQDRMYGGIKVFEKKYTQADHNEVWRMFEDVMRAVETHLAPPRLPSNDPWCTNSNMCPYRTKCSQY